MRMRRVFDALTTVRAVAIAGDACAACGGGDSSDEAGASDSNFDEPATTTVEATTTFSPNGAVIADHHFATEVVQGAFDAPDPQHPDKLSAQPGLASDELVARLQQAAATNGASGIDNFIEGDAPATGPPSNAWRARRCARDPSGGRLRR